MGTRIIRDQRIDLRYLIALSIVSLIVASGLAAVAAVLQAGPQVNVYRTTFNGLTPPPVGNDPAAFNTSVYGGPTPGTLLSTASTYGGLLLNELTAGNQFSGTQLYACTPANFATCDPSGNAVAAVTAPGSTTFEFIAVQTWPFYVDTGAASNINPGVFTAETTSDDSSWLVLASKATTYAQPANFFGATGLVAGTAVVHNISTGTPASATGTFSIATQAACSSNLYWFTMEYNEAQGGAAKIEYSWQPPGAVALQQVSQGVVMGQVRYFGVGAANETVKVTDASTGTHTLTTDANGCFGYNYQPVNTGLAISIAATDVQHGGGTQSGSLALRVGSFVTRTFDFPPPTVEMTKRITRVATFGPTPGPATTPQVIVPTPDPGSLAGVNGTANFQPGFYPRDAVTFTLYFRNIGSTPANGSGAFSPGPTFQDILQSPQAYVASSQAFVCCTSPAVTIGDTFTQTGNTLKWVMAAALPTPNPHGSASPIQGNMSYQVTIP